MIKKSQALEFDALDKPIEAANAYEASIQLNEADLEVYLNLAVLYFCCNDGGYAAYHKLSKEFLEHSWNRMWEVLDEAENRYGKNLEIEFWRYYFKAILLGGESFFSECLTLVEKDGSDIPYFYLFLFQEGRHFQSQAESLYSHVIDGSTQKKRYIRSILENYLPKYKSTS